MFSYNKIKFGIQVEKLEEYLKKEIYRIVNNAIQDAGIAVSQGQKEIELILTEITSEIEVLKEKVRTFLNPEIKKLEEEISVTDIDAKRTDNETKRERITKKSRDLEVDIRRKKLNYDWNSYWWIQFAIAALCSIDGIANYAIFQLFITNLIGSIFVSILVAISLAWAAHIIGARYREAQTPKLRRIWFIGGLSGAGAAFFMLGIWRQTYMNSSELSLFPLQWMLFNLFFFAIALLLAAMKLPTKEERLERRDLLEMKKQLKDLEKADNNLQAYFEKEEQRNNDCKLNLEKFKSYRDGLITSLEKEQERIHAMSNKEFGIKNGNTTKVNSTSKTKQHETI